VGAAEVEVQPPDLKSAEDEGINAELAEDAESRCQRSTLPAVSAVNILARRMVSGATAARA